MRNRPNDPEKAWLFERLTHFVSAGETLCNEIKEAHTKIRQLKTENKSLRAETEEFLQLIHNQGGRLADMIQYVQISLEGSFDTDYNSFVQGKQCAIFGRALYKLGQTNPLVTSDLLANYNMLKASLARSACTNDKLKLTISILARHLTNFSPDEHEKDQQNRDRHTFRGYLSSE